jgi:hypothetical protein
LPTVSGKPKILLIYSFYYKLLATNNQSLIDSFAGEFIEEYLNELNFYSPHYSPLQQTNELINNLEELKSISSLLGYRSKIESVENELKNKLNDLQKILENKKEFINGRGELYFPLLGKVTISDETIHYASIEKIKVKISPAKEKDNFIVIPSTQRKTDLEEQAKISLKLALQYLGTYKKKILKYHEVIIRFENLTADYDGKSLGIILTIGFIEQLSILYNLPFIVHIKDRIAATGSVDNEGKIISIGKENITSKVEAVFYSETDTLVIPKNDEADALTELQKLQKSFPNRRLAIIPIENLTDLINRRNIVDIKKQKQIIRVAKGLKRNWIPSLLSFLLIIILLFFYLREFDNNPYSYEQSTNDLLIKNKSDKVLWHIKNHFRIKSNYYPYFLKSIIRILDTNKDGKNEVLFTFQDRHEYVDSSKTMGLVLLNNKGEMIWKHSFEKNVLSKREVINSLYFISLFDTLTIDNELCILCGASNDTSYPSALYLLNLSKNKIVSDTLWNAGHFVDARILNLNSNKKKELVILAHNNGYSKISLINLPLDDLRGQTRTSDDYKLIGIKDAVIKNQFLFPNTDYNQYLGFRNMMVLQHGLYLYPQLNQIHFSALNKVLDGTSDVNYTWQYTRNDFEISIVDGFRVERDSLVAHGILSLPFTDTKEYRELMRKQILAWDGKEFVPIDEYNKKRAALN